ncbi:MAG: GNAT family N-acetyltransferase [Thalassobius sp.]|nr:GNAT family N-acetyltransferase [Thalassovita sp.]
MEYTIEQATKAEHLEIIEVWEASVRATHHFLSEEDIAYFKPLILDNYLDAVELRCAKDENNKIVGFLGVAEENLEMLFLHPDTIGKGLGKKMLHYVLQNLNVKKVDVNEDNPDAAGFYKSQGFKVISRSETDPQGKPFPILHMEYKPV